MYKDMKSELQAERADTQAEMRRRKAAARTLYLHHSKYNDTKLTRKSVTYVVELKCYPCEWRALFTPLPPMVVALVVLSLILLSDKREANREWALSSWDFAKKTIPLMAIGIIITGMLLGSIHGDTSIPGLIPSEWVQHAVGGNGVLANCLSSFTGAFMYFSTLTEIPIVQGLLASGMGKGPALALLLAGPSLSLPNMLVVSGVMGWRKTAIYVSLVIVLSTISGYIYGNFWD